MKYKQLIINKIMQNKNVKYSKKMLQSQSKINYKEFNEDLHDLLEDKILCCDSKHRYSFANKSIEICKFLYNQNGYGFGINLYNEDNSLKRIFLPHNAIKNAVNEDIIAIRITKPKTEQKNAEGVVVDIIAHTVKTVIGTYIKYKTEDDFGFVIAENDNLNMDIFVADRNKLTAESYDRVIVEIDKYPEGNNNAEGHVIQNLGIRDNSNKVDYLSIITEYGFKDIFPSKVLRQVERINESISDKEFDRRKNYTGLCTFTIDGETSKDLDDAISIEKKGDSYLLGVHIADVTHYVTENSPLDREALARSTSVYMINKVIPMLPKKLSNGLCSLNPNTVRLTLSVLMNINKKGEIESCKIEESYIKSRSQLFYKNVSDFLETGAELKIDESIKGTEEQEKLEESLKIAAELQHILKKKRFDRGALDFESAESEIKLDENDKPISVKAYETRIANKIIEEFMIVCNEAVARYFNELDIPFVYRVHEKPKEDKLNAFIMLLNNLGYKLPTDLSSKTLQDVLVECKGKEEEDALNLMLLQSMQQAKYQPTEIGHFALATKYYCHFTSPIRRYPDLQIHRIIKDYLNNRLNKVRLEKLRDIVVKSSEQSSKQERLAQKAEMEYDSIKRAEYISDKKDVKYNGVVLYVSKKFCRILLDNTVEGLIPLTDDDNEYEIEQENYSVINTKTNDVIKVGDKIVVKVKRVDIYEGLVIFEKI